MIGWLKSTSCMSTLRSWEDVLGFKEICSILFETQKPQFLAVNLKEDQQISPIESLKTYASQRRKQALDYETQPLFMGARKL